MSYKFFNNESFSRIDVARQLFSSFADRIIGYHLNIITSVVLFNQNIQTGCAFTENILNFVNVINNCELGIGSKL